MHRTCVIFATFLVLGIATLQAQTTRPAPAMQPADCQVGEMREQTMAGYSFCYLSTEASVKTIGPAVGKLMPQLDKAMRDGTIKPSGPVVFIYRGTAESFTLEVGVVVATDTKAAGDFQVRTLPPFHCAAILYSGPVASLSRAYQELMPQVFQAFQPTSDWREVYLYWEGEQSPNNVVQIQMGIR